MEKAFDFKAYKKKKQTQKAKASTKINQKLGKGKSRACGNPI